MIKTIIKSIYYAFVSIVLISIVLTAWTGYVFISQPSKSSEIVKVIKNIYISQKSVILDVIDLSKLLVKDTSSTMSSENNFLVDDELLTDLEDNSQFDKSTILEEDSLDNPLGIVIEPSLPEASEHTLPEIIEESLVDKQNDISINEMEMDIGMDMN